MKIFTNKNIIQKIIIVLVVVMLFNFCIPKKVQAFDAEELGGILMNAIVSFFTTILDGVNFGMQFLMIQDTTDIVSESSPRKFGKFTD